MEYDYIVYIGRFQPFHAGHEATIRKALTMAKKVIVLVGSSNVARSSKNPFSYEERREMIEKTMQDDDVLVDELWDTPTDDLWVKDVGSTVRHVVTMNHSGMLEEPVIGIIGLEKDDSSYYLKRFPLWDHIPMENIGGLNATDIREILLDGCVLDKSYQHKFSVVSRETQEILDILVRTPEFLQVRDEYDHLEAYKDSYRELPYPPVFVTVDAVVVDPDGLVLMIKRGGVLGKGLFAMPGGFVEHDQTILQALAAELKEEVNLNLDDCEIISNQVFDDPNRSQRGRTITHAYLLEVSHDVAIDVREGDDAASFQWVDVGLLHPTKIFEDHRHIVKTMTGAEF